MSKNSNSNSHITTQIPRSGYFKAPDAIFITNLSAYAKLVLLYLCRRADNAGISFPSKNTIAKDCGICRRTVDKVIKEIVSFGLIEVQPKVKRSNRYKLNDSIVKLLKGELNLHDMPGYRAGDAPLNVQEMPTKEYTYKENTTKEQDKLGEFEVFFEAFRETNKLLGRENCGDKGKALAEYQQLSSKDIKKLIPYLAECKRKKLVADAARVVKMDLKDPDIIVPNLSWFSDCPKFLKDREWESKNMFPVEPVLNTESELQKKQWEKEGYVEGQHFKLKKAEVNENVA